jgi:outer membrane protein insertion porin family
VGSLRAEGDDIFAAEQIQSRLTLQEGEIYVRSSLQQDIVNLTEVYAQRGHPFADVIPTTEVDDEALEVHIVITPRKGRRVFVGQVVIRGNDFTRDRIVRRQVRLEEGALYDGQQLQNTRRRINNLGFFEEVKIETKRGASEDLLDVDIELKEKPTGAVSGGLGFSSRAKLIVFGEIREANLFGRGQALALRLSASAIDTTGTLSFTEPNFFDTNFSFFTSAFAQSEEFDSFDRDRLGGGMGFGRSFGENVFGRLLYQLEFNDIFNIQDNAILDVEDQEGKVTTSSIFPSLVRDTTDNRFRPTRGAIGSVRGQVAGKAYGSDNNFYSLFLEYRQFYPLLEKRVIFMGRGQLGYSDGFGGDELPVFERLFLGGARTVRGFDFREVGPKDTEDRPVGGNASLLFNFELQFPFAAGFRAVTFFDTGQIYNKSGIYDLGELRESVGAGVRVLTPLGPVSLDWGYKLDRRSGEDASELHFAIGRQF